MTTGADREVSKPCACEGSCPCCRLGEVIDHHCPNCLTTFCPDCHGIASASWARAYDNVSKCHCKPEVNPLEPITITPKTKGRLTPKTKGREDVSIFLDVEGRQPAAFRDPNILRGFIRRLARRQEDVISALRELNRRITQVEKQQILDTEQLRALSGIYEVAEGEDIEDVINRDTNG